MSVLPRGGKGEWKTVRCEDDISLSVSFGCRYIHFHLSSLVSVFFAVCAHVYDCVACLVTFELHWACFLSVKITVYCSKKKTVIKMNVLILDNKQALLVL